MRHPIADLTALVDGALAPARAEEVEHHLASCETCRTEKERLLAALHVLARLPPSPEPSPFFLARLEARLRDEPLPEQGGILSRLAARWRIAVPVGALAAVAAAALLVVRVRAAHEQEFARNLPLFEDYEVVANLDTLNSPEDAVIAANLDAIEPAGVKR